MPADLAVLLDAFVAHAPRNASLNLHGDDQDDALLHWSIERGHGATTSELKSHGYHWQAVHWQAVQVTLANGAYVAAHREGGRVDQPAEVPNG